MLLDEIKTQTSRIHKRVEADLDILSDTFTLDDYRLLLGRFLGFVRPWEARIRRCLGAESGLFEERRKAVRLEQDLRSLGLREEAIEGVALCSDLPRIESVESALGSMYVFEGATLGGQVIARRLRSRFGLEAGSSFFNSYGDEVGPMWKAFRGVLARHSSPAADPIVIEAAVETFDRFGRWLEGRKK